MEYDFKKIEAKWQKKWEKEKIYEVKENPKKDKFYCLIEFPYPSGEGLHVGHPRSYTALDIVARKNRMQGKNILYPIGWDAYGLPTENYAIKTGIQPAAATEKNIKNFTRQLKSLGFSFDWSREINTADPKYYKWTQWMFLQFFKHGLAYKDKIAINWCTKCKIGLANEEVVNGVCERCGGTVEKRMKEQWMIKITKYAERLLEGLENVDYSPRIKEGQINWIGKSEGAEVDFGIKAGKINLGEKHTGKKIDKMFQALDQINDALSKEKIKVWFNGTFGVAGYYGYIFDDPRDVDCGVLIKDFDRARKVIENLGYKKVEDKENPKFKVSIYNAGDFTLEIGTFDHDLGDKIVELEGYKFRVPEPRWFAECYRITAPKERRMGKNDALRAEFLESISGDFKIKVFTTRPDTLFGATYMVLAPEHELVQKLKSKITNWSEVEKYIGEAKRKSDLERTELQKEKTGVELKGIKAVNPANNEIIPIWVADYVLTGYGTGAIMAVPAHDERDFEFATKFNLPIREVVVKKFGERRSDAVRRDSVAGVVLNKDKKVLVLHDKKFDIYRLPAGAYEKNETPEETLKREIQEESGYVNIRIGEFLGTIETNFDVIFKKEYRHKFQKGYLVRLLGDEQGEMNEEGKEIFEKMWLDYGEAMKRFAKNKESWGEEEFIRRVFEPKEKCFAGEGAAINSDFLSELPTSEAKEKITKWLEEKKIGKKAVNYKLRDWVFSRQRYWGEPIPLVYCENCAKKKQKILLIHGLGGNPQENWFPWFKKQMEDRGFEVIIPDLPKPEKLYLKDWLSELGKLGITSNDDLFVVGHSLGGPAACQFILKNNLSVKKLILVAPVGKSSDWRQLKKYDFSDDEIATISRFGEAPIDFAKLRSLVADSVLYFSEDDPYIPLKIKNDYEYLGGSVKIFKDKKHFGSHWGITELPEILEEFPTSLNLGWQPVPEKDLPVELPKVKKYEPTDTGESPLAAIEKWVNTKCPKCGGEARRETDTMPNWAGSSWYFMRYADPKNKKEFASGKNLKYWMPVDWYNGGMEHTTLHLLYSRFWYKFLYDIGAVPKECGDEPYKKRTSHGLILGEGGEKMSKSRGNVVNPDDIVARFGADTLRAYEMFMGPFEQAIPWDEKGVVGVFRFLERVWKLQEKVSEKEGDKKIEKVLHQTIKKVSEDIEQMKFNTAVSALMILTNEMSAQKELPITNYQLLITLLAPFAPHLAEELWEKLGNKKSVHLAEWPKYNPAMILEEEIDLIIQVNGKMRDSIKVKANIGEEEAKKVATESEKVKKWIEGQKIKKIIFVKGRLVNIVV